MRHLRIPRLSNTVEYCENTFSAVYKILRQSQNKVSKCFSLFVQCWVDRHVASVHVIVSLAFVNVMDRIITIIVLLFLYVHLFVLIFGKLKTGPRPTLFSGESLLNGHLY